MLNFILYAVSLFGFCYIIGLSKISAPIRNWLFKRVVATEVECKKCGGKIISVINVQNGSIYSCCEKCTSDSYTDAVWQPFKWPLQMLECPACLSTWVGAFIGLFVPRFAVLVCGIHFGRWYMFALLSAGSSAIIGLLTGVME